jgi:hypothetical protein
MATKSKQSLAHKSSTVVYDLSTVRQQGLEIQVNAANHCVRVILIGGVFLPASHRQAHAITRHPHPENHKVNHYRGTSLYTLQPQPTITVSIPFWLIGRSEPEVKINFSDVSVVSMAFQLSCGDYAVPC